MTKSNVHVVDYADHHHHAFRQLNLEWLDAYQLRDDHDLLILDDPQGIILEKGGAIFLAMADGEVIGTAALMKKEESVFELAKMAVKEEYRGQGISKLLIERCMEHARNNGAKKITLFSNHQLVAAISLYEKYGFRHVPVKDSPFESADVQMERFL